MTAEAQRLRKANQKLAEELEDAAEKITRFADKKWINEVEHLAHRFKCVAERYKSEWSPLESRTSLKKENP